MNRGAFTHRSAGRPAPLRQQALQDWLDGPAAILHGWSPQVDDLQEAVRGLLAQASSRHPRVFDEAEFLPVLHRLNQQLAAAPAGTPRPKAREEQLWVLARADRMVPDQLDLLRRLVVHYPELRIRMAWFSLAQQPPQAQDGVHLLDLPSHGAGAAPDPVLRWTGTAGQRRRTAFGLGGVALAALAGALMWWGNQDLAGRVSATAESAEPAAPTASAAATGASEAPDAPPAVSAASEAAPTPAPQEAASPASGAGAASALPAAVSAAARWLQGLPEGSLLVVHARVLSLAQAQALRRSDSVLANAQVLMSAQETSAGRYLVVTGPFRSAERAQNYMQKLAWKADARSVTREELLAQTLRSVGR